MFIEPFTTFNERRTIHVHDYLSDTGVVDYSYSPSNFIATFLNGGATAIGGYGAGDYDIWIQNNISDA